jgi:hypothetical protein
VRRSNLSSTPTSTSGIQRREQSMTAKG